MAFWSIYKVRNGRRFIKLIPLPLNSPLHGGMNDTHTCTIRKFGGNFIHVGLHVI